MNRQEGRRGRRKALEVGCLGKCSRKCKHREDGRFYSLLCSLTRPRLRARGGSSVRM